MFNTVCGVGVWVAWPKRAKLGGLPTTGLPAGFHPNQLWPMGIQRMGKPREPGLAASGRSLRSGAQPLA